MDIDSDWDSYVDSIDKAGLSDLLAIYDTAYERSVGSDSAE